MFAFEIISNLKKLEFKNNFSGIFASDKIPKTLKNKHFIVVNRDPSNLPGSHWFVIFRLNSLIEVFDSLGIGDHEKSFISNNLNFKGITHIIFNVTPVQQSSSSSCGQFVLYYLFERFYNFDLDFDELLNEIFSSDLSANELSVSRFVNTFLN